MSKYLVLVAATFGCTPLSWNGGFAATASADPSPPSAPTGDRAELWKRYAVRDIVLGTPLARLRGFTCDASHGVCEKILNPAICETACDVAQDERLEYLRVTPAATDTKRIYRIEYRFRTSDYLSPDSSLGRALISKYGKPEALEPEYRQRALWQGAHGSEGPQVEISCASGTCTVVAEDRELAYAEEQQQRQIDIARQKAHAGPPPKL